MYPRLLILLITVSTFPSSSSAQNLVPNGDFEIFTVCPDNLDQLSNAGWSPYAGTADYFHACDQTSFVGTPLNIANGFQYPLSGDGYGGLIGISYNNSREIMGTELSTPLDIGTEYYVEFYWSRTFGGQAHANCDCASSHLGALFTTQAYHNVTNIIPVTNFAHVYDPTLLVDSTNWVKISGWFTADSSYTHIAIGDFFELDSNETANFNISPEPVALKTYYYIEDVCVATDSAFCSLINATNFKVKTMEIQLFPNPSSNVLHIDTELRIQSISIAAAVDGKLYSDFSLVGNQVDISKLAEGLYIITIETDRGLIRKKFIKINSL